MSIEVIALREVSLESCRFYAKQVARSEAHLLEHVDHARRSGCSWTEIGEALGVTHQNAIKRFGDKVTKVDLRAHDNPRRAEIRAAHGWKGQKDAT